MVIAAATATRTGTTAAGKFSIVFFIYTILMGIHQQSTTTSGDDWAAAEVIDRQGRQCDASRAPWYVFFLLYYNYIYRERPPPLTIIANHSTTAAAAATTVTTAQVGHETHLRFELLVCFSSLGPLKLLISFQ